MRVREKTHKLFIGNELWKMFQGLKFVAPTLPHLHI